MYFNNVCRGNNRLDRGMQLLHSRKIQNSDRIIFLHRLFNQYIFYNCCSHFCSNVLVLLSKFYCTSWK
jgi:hypothetical protein